MRFKLRDYQLDGVQRIRQAYQKGFKAPLFVLPTGAGKTVIFNYIAESAEKLGNRTLIIVHRSYLWQQASDKLTEAGINHGIIAPKKLLTNEKIQIASVDTLIRRLDKIIPPDLIIFDEGHHLTKGNKWGKVIEKFPNAKILGVTATPARTSGQGLGVDYDGYYDTIIIGRQPLDLMPKYLTPFKVFAPKSDFSDSEVKIIGGDYSKKDLETQIDKRAITGDAVGHYLKYCYNIPSLVFCVSVKHAENVAAQFCASGVNAIAVSGKTDERQRQYVFKGLANGHYKIVCSCDLISEGFDVPVCGAGILLRPTQSLGLFLQQCGRLTRLAPNKKNAIIVDAVGNCYRHGLPQQNRNWSLAGVPPPQKRELTDESLSIRNCPNCFNVHEFAPICPECGYEYGTQDKTPQQVQGELLELKLQEERDYNQRQIKRKLLLRQAKTLEDFNNIADDLGYKKGWAWWAYTQRQKKLKRKAG